MDLSPPQACAERRVVPRGNLPLHNLFHIAEMSRITPKPESETISWVVQVGIKICYIVVSSFETINVTLRMYFMDIIRMTILGNCPNDTIWFTFLNSEMLVN